MIKNIFFTISILMCFQAMGQKDFILSGKVIFRKNRNANKPF